jgi:hypothetical protein
MLAKLQAQYPETQETIHMATTTQSKTGVPSFDTAFEQVRESSEQVLAAARKAGNLYLDSYEKAVDRTTELQLKLAGLSQQEWLKSLIEAQVDVTRELAGSYTTTARSLLK